jgi:hypothetical protein
MKTIADSGDRVLGFTRPVHCSCCRLFTFFEAILWIAQESSLLFVQVWIEQGEQVSNDGIFKH